MVGYLHRTIKARADPFLTYQPSIYVFIEIQFVIFFICLLIGHASL